MKKKIFPILAIFTFFVTVMVLQMSLNGNYTSAQKTSITEEKSKAYEEIFNNLKLETTKGSVFELKDINQDLVILNFWASWCQPCVSEFKALNELVDMFSSEQLLVVGINNDDEEPLKNIKKVEKKYNLKFESVMDVDSDIAGKYRINNIPASVVYYKGKVIHFVNKEFDFVNDGFVDLLKSKISAK